MGLFVIVVLVLTQVGCMQFKYKPSLFELEEGKISSFDVKGEVLYENAQTGKSKQLTKQGGHTWEYNYNLITDGFNRQLAKEIKSMGEQLDAADSKKTFSSKITAFKCDVTFGSFVRNCSSSVTVTTGDGEIIAIESSQKSPIFATMEHSLDGTVATAVIDVLSNDKVLAYLAK